MYLHKNFALNQKANERFSQIVKNSRMRRRFLSILLLLYFVEAKKEIFELQRGPRPDNPDIESIETHLPCPDNCECEEKCTPCDRPDFNFLKFEHPVSAKLNYVLKIRNKLFKRHCRYKLRYTWRIKNGCKFCS